MNIDQDILFAESTKLFFSDKKKFKRYIQLARNSQISYSPDFLFALNGHIHYLKGNYKKAAACYMKAIDLSADNIDNWINLAFCLRHLDEIAMSKTILFNYDYIIRYYKLFKLRLNNLRNFKRLAEMINKYAC